MAKERDGLRFEVYVNGRRLCVSGINGFGVLDVILTRVKRSPKQYPGRDKHPLKISKAEWSKERIELSVGGLESMTDQFLHWMRRNLRIGDEVSIRLLEPGRYDVPKGYRRRLTGRSRGTRARTARAPHRGRYIPQQGS